MRCLFSLLSIMFILSLVSFTVPAEARTKLEETICNYLEEKNAQKALSLLEKQQRRKPDIHWLYCRKGDAFVLLDQKNEAEKAYSVAIRIDPTCITARERRAQLRFDDRRFDEALSDLESIAEMRNYSIGKLLAKCYFELGLYEKCVEVCEQTMWGSGSEDLYLLKAEANARLRRFTQARDDQISAKKYKIHGTIGAQGWGGCERVERFKKKSLAHNTFAQCIADIQYKTIPGLIWSPETGFVNGDGSPEQQPGSKKPRLIPRRSNFISSATIPAAPNPALLEVESLESLQDYLQRAMLLVRSGRFDEGIEVLKRADSRFPSEHQIYCTLGSAFNLQDDKRKSYKCFSRAHELDPGCQTALERKISFAKDFGFSAEQIHDTEKLMEAVGESRDLLYDIAMANFDIGLYQKCVEDCDRALSLSRKGAWDIYSLRAQAHRKLGNIEEAKRDEELGLKSGKTLNSQRPIRFFCDYFKPDTNR